LNEEVKKARRLIAAVSLASVRLLETSAKTRIRISDITEDMHPQFVHSARVSPEGLREGVFYVLASLVVRIISESDQKEHATMKVQFELGYRLPSDFTASRSELNAFAMVNGVFNAWPYFREFVQSISQKMDLPVILLPVFRVPQQPRSVTAVAAPSS
jgi:hypothetical protein